MTEIKVLASVYLYTYNILLYSSGVITCNDNDSEHLYYKLYLYEVYEKSYVMSLRSRVFHEKILYKVP